MQEYLFPISKELDNINKQLKSIFLFKNDLGDDLKKFISGNSKRIRSIVSLLYLKSLKENISDKCLTIITAGEIIHNASLLQDDVIDEAEIRRGETTIGAKFSPKISILSGDYLLSLAIENLLSVNNSYIIQSFLKCTKKMCQSEIEQYFLRGKLPDIETYIKICKGKTAELFCAILESCAYMEELNIEDAQKFACNFGIFFQLKNDLEKFSALTDKKNNIFTPKDIFGIEKTLDLIDNYSNRIRCNINKLPDNVYKKGLEVLVTKL